MKQNSSSVSLLYQWTVWDQPHQDHLPHVHSCAAHLLSEHADCGLYRPGQVCVCVCVCWSIREVRLYLEYLILLIKLKESTIMMFLFLITFSSLVHCWCKCQVGPGVRPAVLRLWKAGHRHLGLDHHVCLHPACSLLYHAALGVFVPPLPI